MKIRNNLYLDREVTEALDALARKPGANKSRIASELLKGALAQRAAKPLEAAFKPRLNSISSDIRAGNRIANAVLEAVMLLVRHLFTVLPPLAENDAAAAAEGAQRFERFIDELGRELAKSKGLLSSLPDPEATR